MKRKRKMTRKRIKEQNKMRIIGVNAAGIKCKLKSFESLLNKVNPQIWALQETKLKENERIKCKSLENYEVYYLYRSESDGGGSRLE